jgi:hypothetical protein
VNKKIKNNKNMNSPVVGIEIGEKKSVVTYLSPEGEVRDNFEFTMNNDGYTGFAPRYQGKQVLHLRHPDQLTWWAKHSGNWDITT